MKFSKSVIELIKSRTSWRTYNEKSLTEDVKEKIREIIKDLGIKTPFDKGGGKCRFKLIEVSDFSDNERKNLGLHKIISGSYDFIVGEMGDGQFNKEKYGYLLEIIILKMHDMGLGTCWLAGYFNREIIPPKIDSGSEKIPAITTVGYPIQRSPIGLKIRRNVKSDERHSWKTLFFEGDTTNPLEQKKVDKNYSIPLEMLRFSPSASNRQPWRVIKEEKKNIFHFYTTFSHRWRRLDLGISIAHFDQTVKELDLNGKWSYNNPEIIFTKDLLYVISWCGNDS